MARPRAHCPQRYKQSRGSSRQCPAPTPPLPSSSPPKSQTDVHPSISTFSVLLTWRAGDGSPINGARREGGSKVLVGGLGNGLEVTPRLLLGSRRQPAQSIPHRGVLRHRRRRRLSRGGREGQGGQRGPGSLRPGLPSIRRAVSDSAGDPPSRCPMGFEISEISKGFRLSDGAQGAAAARLHCRRCPWTLHPRV